MSPISQQAEPSSTNETLWKDRIHNWQASGVSQSAFCKQEGFNLGAFNKWKVHFLGKQKSAAMSTKKKQRFIPVDVEPNSTAPQSPQTVIEVILPNKLAVKVPQGMLTQQIISTIECLSRVHVKGTH